MLAFIVSLVGQSVMWAAEQPPNIVLIMADDLGVEGLGCYGGQSYQTPRLDQMAKDGMRFTHAYAQPLCTNTRVQLMTGLYNHRNWLYFGILDPNAKTFGHWMQEANYDTCIVGKWQLQSYDPPDYPGADSRRGTGMRVEDAGFDEYCLWHTGHTEAKGSRYADPVLYQNGAFRNDTKDRYGPDLWAEYIDDYLSRRRSSDRSAKPFFLYYSMALPHWPMVPTPDSPDWADRSRRDEEDVRYFKDMVEYTDKIVGRVLDSIESHGFRDNTVVIFYSDNGTNLKVTSQTKDGPVVGGKGETTDAGTHVPLIVRWPNRIEPRECDDIVDSTDFLPTLRAASGQPLARSTEIDGVSFWPQLRGESGSPREWTFCHFDPRPGWDKDRFQLKRFARDKRFKLYATGDLFDIEADKLEQQPIRPGTDSPESAAARRRLLDVFEKVK